MGAKAGRGSSCARGCGELGFWILAFSIFLWPILLEILLTSTDWNKPPRASRTRCPLC